MNINVNNKFNQLLMSNPYGSISSRQSTLQSHKTSIYSLPSISPSIRLDRALRKIDQWRSVLNNKQKLQKTDDYLYKQKMRNSIEKINISAKLKEKALDQIVTL